MSRGAALAALALDLALGEPPTALHPVGWMGRLVAAGRAQRTATTPAPSLAQGAALLAAGGALCWLAASAAQRAAGALPPAAGAAARGALLKPALSLRALLGAGAEVEGALRAGDLPEARRLLGWHLVSRDTAALSAAEVAGAAIESLAENLGDGLVGPLLAHRAGGLPAAYLYRWANTCDAMLAYRTPELEWYGKAAARADDLANLLPARLAALLLVTAAALIPGASAGGAARAALGDARRTASPNAGWPMAAAAGALGVRLTKRGAYELNPGGREPDHRDLARARALVAAAGGLAALLVEAA